MAFFKKKKNKEIYMEQIKGVLAPIFAEKNEFLYMLSKD